MPPDMPRVTFLGKDAKTTVITAGMSAKEAGGTFLSATVTVYGAAFEAENITFENTFGPGSQAVAVTVYSDRAVFRNCRFLGWQDTLYAAAAGNITSTAISPARSISFSAMRRRCSTIARSTAAGLAI